MKNRLSLNKANGSALMTVVVFAGILLLIAGAILSWSRTEMRVDVSHKRRLVARNITEALLEYGAANAALQVQEVTDFTNSFCDPSSSTTALSLPPSDMFAGTSIDTSTLEIVGKVTPPTPGKTDIKSSDPSNTYSSLRGLSGKAGKLTLLARASTLPDSFGRRDSVYAIKSYTILDGPVLQYAAFYNMDLEAAPGPTLNIYGPVHTNRDLWVSKQSNNGNTLNFWEQVTAVGKIRKGFKVQPIQADGSREVSAGDPVQFMSPSGSLINLYGSWGAGTIWRDQFMGTSTDQSVDFRSFTNTVYGNGTTPSFLQTSAHGILRRPLPGQLDNYVPDPDPTDGIVDVAWRNVPRALIERPLKSGDAEYLGVEVEKQKMARKAGLYIIVNASGAAITTGVRDPAGNDISGGLLAGEYRAWVRDPDASTPSSPVYKEVFLPGQPTFGTHTGHSTTLPLAREIIHVDVRQMVDMRRFNEKTSSNPSGFNYLQARSSTNIYQPKRINLIEVDMTALKKAVEKTVNGNPNVMIFPYDTETAGSRNYNSTYRATTAEFGVTTLASGRTGNPALTNADLIENMNPKDWDGSVYIESLQADFLLTAAPITAANPDPSPYPQRRAYGHRRSGVRLINGRGPIVSASASRVADTTYPCSPGLTLSTNDALYILGHLNADGNIQSTSSPPTSAQLNSMATTDASSSGNNSSLFPDPPIVSGAPTEKPLCLVADAITILSQPTFDSGGVQNGGWTDSLSHLAISGTSGSNWNSNWMKTTASGSNARDGGFPSSIPGSAVNTSADCPLDAFDPGDDPTTWSTVSGSATAPYQATKFAGANTEISAGFIVGLTPSAKNPTSSTNDGNNSGGLHNLPRFLENWSATCAIRGSMVVMFESQVAWEPWSLRMYGPPTRLWGFHNFFRNFTFSDDIPATRNLGVSVSDTFQLLTRDDYIAQRNAMWPSYTFPGTVY